MGRARIAKTPSGSNYLAVAVGSIAWRIAECNDVDPDSNDHPDDAISRKRDCPTMKYYAPDTNFFLQCQDYLTLDWSSLVSDEEIWIVVPRAVQREIDRHKGSGNTRRASRARRISSMFDEVLEADDCRMTGKGRGKTIMIELLWTPVLAAEDFPLLDLANPDDQIIAEVQWFSRKNPDDEVTLITDDTAAKRTARAVGLRYSKPPSEWLLPPEPDPRDKAMAEMQRRITALERETPVLQFEHAYKAGGPPTFELTLYAPLNEVDVHELIEFTKTYHPMQTEFSVIKPAQNLPPHLQKIAEIGATYAAFGTTPPSEGEIRRYQAVAYPEWITLIEQHLRRAHEVLNDARAVMFISISNAGSRPARNLLVEFRIEGPAVFSSCEESTEEQGKSRSAFPGPPAPPKRKSIGADFLWERQHGGSLSGVDFSGFKLPDLPQIEPRDPNRFYQKDDDAISPPNAVIFECSAFRHQHQPEEFRLDLFPAQFQEGEVSVAIRCLAHAENAAQVLEQVIPVRLSVRLGDTRQRAKEMLRMVQPDG